MSDFFCDPLEDEIIYHTEYKVFFAPPVYNEQLYSLIIWSKPGFFPLGIKPQPIQSFMIHIYFELIFFSLEVQFVARRPSPRVLQSTDGNNHAVPRCRYYYLHDPKILIEKAERLKIIFNCQHGT
jgi:hypothetical protein